MVQIGIKEVTDDSTGNHTTSKDDSMEKSRTRRISLSEVFRFATFSDRLLILFGTLFAIIEGMGLPLMAMVFGNMADSIIKVVRNDTSAEPIAAPISANVNDSSVQTNITGVPPTVSFINNTITNQASTIANSQDDTAQFERSMTIFALFYTFLGVAMYISSLVQVTCWQVARERQLYRIRRAFYRSIMRQELAWFDKNQSGELSAKFNDQIERIREGIGEHFSSVIKNTASFLSGFVVGFLISWRLTFVIMLATPLLAIFSAYLGHILTDAAEFEQQKYASAGALAEEVLVALRTVLALGGQREEISKYSAILESGKNMAISKYLKMAITLGLSMFTLYATYGLALFVSTILLDIGLLTPGAAMTVIMSVMMGSCALGEIVPFLQTILLALTSATSVFQVIDTHPKIDASTERGLKLSKVTANIKFENVTFSYPTRKKVQVLKQMSCEISQGQTVAICGHTGSGKSTVMNLILRFYDPDQGNIYLDNCNLRDLNVAWLRSLIGVVEQEPALFDCSIFDNISLGASHESEKTYERVMEAAKLANAHEFIASLPDGYNTVCGNRGTKLSGGQKQRIAIARALLRDPKILLLDEATSALDSQNEAFVQAALNRARQGRTTVVIAHRLSTIRDADIICVMDQGSMVESGTHEQLLANKGHYYKLVTDQVFKNDNVDESNRAKAADSDYDSPCSNSEIDLANLTKRDTKSADIKNNQNVCLVKQSAEVPLDKLQADNDSVVKDDSKSITLYESINRPVKNQVELQPDNATSHGRPKFRDLFRLLSPEMTYVLFGSLACVFQGALMPTFALFYAQILDTLSRKGDELLDYGVFWSLMFLVLALANFLAMFFRILLLATALEKSTARLRAETFTSILRQHVGWFDLSNNSPQRLTTRLAADAPQIRCLLNTRFAGFISGISTVILALIISFYLGWKLAIVLAFALPLLVYVGYLQMRANLGSSAEHIRRMEDVSRLITESVEHVKLIQSINQERFFFNKFDKCLEGPLKTTLKSARRFGLVYGLSQSCICFVYAISFRWGGHLIANGEMEAMNVFRIFFAISFTAVSVGQMSGLGGDMKQTYQAIAMISKFLSTRSAIDNLSRGGIKPPLKGLITFQDIHFRYPTRSETPVLQGLNLTVKPGETLALVGASGHGKSTVASLLLRFYDPDRGVVRIDNHDIRCINLNYLRSNIGIVSQEPILFKTTIKNNILYGLDPSRYNMKDVEYAAKLANIHDFIMNLPDRYNTEVGDKGTQLSGGQKQRIAIARTIIRNPAIIIMDEATSALDSESEALVNMALDKATKEKTCIKIAHRLSTIKDADHIAVIEKGRVAEIGTHNELMVLGKKGHYYRLMQKQAIS